MTILLAILFTVSFIIGLTIASQEGMVLYFIKEKLTNEDGSPKKKIYEPLFLCYWCMPSIHSLVGYFFAFLWMKNVDLHALFFYPIVVASSSFLTAVLWGLHQLIYKKLDE
jgi:hypothetical protein